MDNFTPLVFVSCINVSGRRTERVLAKWLLNKAVASRRISNESNLVALIGEEVLLLWLANREKNVWFGWAASDTCMFHKFNFFFFLLERSSPASMNSTVKARLTENNLNMWLMCPTTNVILKNKTKKKFQMINICDRISSHKEHLGFHFV